MLLSTNRRSTQEILNYSKNYFIRTLHVPNVSSPVFLLGEQLPPFRELFFPKVSRKYFLALFSASLAAANSVESQGNSESIKKINILKSIEHLLK